MNLYLLSTRNFPQHVSYNTILGLEDEFLTCDRCKGIIRFSKFYNIVNKALRKAGGIADYSVIREINSLEKNDRVFFAAMGHYSLEFYKETLKRANDRLIVYTFDCWESEYSSWDSLFKEIKPYSIFLHIRKRLTSLKENMQMFITCHNRWIRVIIMTEE